ncbi:MAG: zinc ribbon domain-containing protein [Gammaproteobacteria bacterium]
MPLYDYRIGHGERMVEAKHAMSASPSTWGELRAAAGLPDDGTPADTPVQKVLTTGGVVGSSKGGMADLPPCMGGLAPGCGSGMCQR